MRTDIHACPVDPTGRDVQAEGARLRALGTVVAIELPGGVRAWSVNTYAAARKVFADNRFAKDPRKHWPAFINGEIHPDWPLISWVKMDSMAIADGEDHHRLRGLIAKAFSPRRVEAKRPLIERIVAELLDELALTPANEQVDLRERFTYQLPARMICDLFGVPEQARVDVLRGGQVAVRTNLTPAQAEANLLSWQAALRELVAAKRAAPADDMTSDLANARERHNTRVSDSELVGSLFMVFGAGTETVMNMLNNAVVSLLRHPDQLELIRAGKARWDDVVEETLRVDAPIAQLPLRYATEDMTLEGVDIQKGDAVMVCLAAANRDPLKHAEDADRFDITRAGNEHLSFGHGAHFCLGASLARLEALIALPALFDRFPGLALAVRPDQLEPQETFIMNGPRRLPVYLNSVQGRTWC